jgi:uncharacterized membrane protein YoaK (UPF0700 family)
LSPTSHRDRVHLWLMMALTFSTGIIDAVGYLGLDRVFTGNMTGNVVVLGMAVTGADGLPVLGPALALVFFLVGAAIGGRVLRGATVPWSRRTNALFGSVAVMVLAVGFLVMSSDSHAAAITATTLLATAMGAQAATARYIAVKDVTTVVVTSVLTGLAADSRLGTGAGSGSGTTRRIVVVAILLAGAAVGAALLQWHLAAGVLLAGVIIAAVTVAGWVHPASRPSPAATTGAAA